MPLVHFNDELEQKLIELWGEQQRRKGGQMIKRKVREMEMVEALNKYAVQLYGEKNEHEFSLKVVSNKIDNLKSKARDFYKKYTVSTQTGAAVGDGCGGNAGNLDLAAAGAKWGNFKLWHWASQGQGSSVRSTPKVFFTAYHHEQEAFFNKEVKKGFFCFSYAFSSDHESKIS